MTSVIFTLWLTVCPASIDIPDAGCVTVRHVCKMAECAAIIGNSWSANQWVAGAVLARIP